MSPDHIRPIPKGVDAKPNNAGSIPAPDPLASLIRAIDSIEAANDHDKDISPAQAEEEKWITDSLQKSLRVMPLSGDALDIVAALSPTASLSEEFLERIETQRKIARDRLDALKEALQECQPENPGDVIRFLRERSRGTVDQAAEALGLSSAKLRAIEIEDASLLDVKPALLGRFALLVREPLETVIGLLKFAAKRILAREMATCANSALGRFDTIGDSSTAKTERLRLAFARMAEENRRYANFFAEAAKYTKATL
jgi:hypothetical protein